MRRESPFPASLPHPRSPAPGPGAELNMTPMIDVLLVLLIICIVSAMWRHVIPVQTPPACPAAEPAPRRTQLVLRIAPDGITLNGQPVPQAQLETHLRDVFRDRPARLLFVAPDPAVPYHAVIAAMDRARGAGVEVVALMPRGD